VQYRTPDKSKWPIMKKLLFFFASFLVCSCSIEYYPTSFNVPLFYDEQQFEGALCGGKNGYELMLAFSPINHFGVIATGNYANNDQNENSTNNGELKDFNKHLFGEMGLGYFNKLGSKGVFEVYGGYGQGITEGLNKTFSTADYDKASYSKAFFQPQIGIYNNVFEGALVTRLSLIDMKSKVYDYQQSVLFVEPGIVLKVGYKNIKFCWQFGLSIANEDDVYLKFDHSILNFSAGLNFSIGGYAPAAKP
jgi:hypothetical protein